MRILLFLIMLCMAMSTQAAWYKRDEAIMGTAVHVELWWQDPTQANQRIDGVMNIMRRINDSMSPYLPSSELSRINRDAARQPQILSEELLRVFRQALRISELTGGAFDVSFASVGKYYDYRKKIKPASAKIEPLLAAINYRLIDLHEKDRAVFFKHPDLQVDFGGIAKGYAVDEAVAWLQRQGVRHAYVSAGGDSRLLGDKRGRPWIVGIAHPRAKGKYVARLPLRNAAISTSGDYERFFIQAEKRHHHIIDPKTGRSASKVQSVTIVGDSCFFTDGLSTGVFVLGVKKGLALVDSLPGVDAVIVDDHGRLHYSKGFTRK